MGSIQRYDLDRCYSYGEYNKAIEYGKKNNSIAGVGDCIKQLNDYKNRYEQEMAAIINAEKDVESQKYILCEKWSKRRTIALCTLAGSIIINIIISEMIQNTIGLLIMLLLCLLVVVSFIYLLVAAILESIAENSYYKYTKNLWGKFNPINSAFNNTARECYQEIDAIYLNSLEPAHREVVLMRREQNEHHRRVEKIAEEQRRLEAKNLEINKEIQNTQQRLLDIELEREDRYRRR